MSDAYPHDRRSLPAYHYEGKDNACTIESSDRVSGYVTALSRTGHFKKYIFETSWSDDGAETRVSTGEPEKGASFYRPGRTRDDDSLRGLPEGHRHDIVRKATRIATQAREEFLKQEAFLKRRMLEAERIGIVDDGRASVAFLKDGDWLIMHKANAWRCSVRADYMGEEAPPSVFYEALAKQALSIGKSKDISIEFYKDTLHDTSDHAEGGDIM